MGFVVMSMLFSPSPVNEKVNSASDFNENSMEKENKNKLNSV